METTRMHTPVTGHYVKGSASGSNQLPVKLQFSVYGLKDNKPYKQAVLAEFDTVEEIRELVSALQNAINLIGKK
jgi:hypothetical protein